MSVYRSLVALYLKSFYNLPGKKTAGARASWKDILKGIGIALLFVLVVGNFGFIFVMMNLNLYQGLAMAGMQDLLLLNAVVMATLLTLVVGFMTALSTYYLNDMELQLLSMPIRPRALLGAKFTAVYASDAVLSLFFMVTTMVIFGFNEHPNPIFYLWGTVAGLLLPLPAMALSYLILVPILSFARFLRNKKTIMMLVGVLGLVMGLGINIYFQKLMPPMADPSVRAAAFAGPGSLVATMGRGYPPALFAWRAMSEPASLKALVSMLGLAAVCIGVSLLIVFALAGSYARSIVGFNEQHMKKLNGQAADAFIAKRLRYRSPFLAMVAREFKLMNREPMYLLNGPFIVVLMPIIIGIMVVVQKDALMSDPDFAAIQALLNSGLGALLAGLAGAFLGSGTSIACTSVSRDAKALPFIKSLPVKGGTYMLAKLAHGLIFALVGSLVGVGFLGFILKLGTVDMLAALLIALALSSLLNLAGLWLDTANPRLSWDNPIAAMKQNPNAILAMLGSMGFLGVLGYLAFKRSMSTGDIALWIGLLPLLVFVSLLPLYTRFAERRLAMMEA